MQLIYILSTYLLTCGVLGLQTLPWSPTCIPTGSTKGWLRLNPFLIQCVLFCQGERWILSCEELTRFCRLLTQMCFYFSDGLLKLVCDAFWTRTVTQPLSFIAALIVALSACGTCQILRIWKLGIDGVTSGRGSQLWWGDWLLDG